MRSGLVAGCLAVAVVVGTAAGCSGKKAPRPLSMEDVAAAVTAAPLLHWTGFWTGYGHSMSLDLRAMGNGDAIGTVADHGDPAQVIVVDDSKVLLKGGKAYWSHGDYSAAEIARYAGRWVDEGGSVWGARLGEIAPRKLGGALKDDITDESGSPAPIPWTPVPASPTMTVTPRPTPSGVPSGALRFNVDESMSSFRGGMFWASASAPHVLVGYSGAGMPILNEDTSSMKQTTLSVQAGGAQDAKAAYTQLAAQARTLPKTMTVDGGTPSDISVDKVDLPTHCRSGSCHIKVTAHNDSDEHRSVQGTVRVVLYGARSMVTNGSDERAVGHCDVKVPLLAPGKKFHTSCNMTDSRIDKYWDSIPGSFFKIGYWDEKHQVISVSEQEPYDPAALAAELDGRAR